MEVCIWGGGSTEKDSKDLKQTKDLKDIKDVKEMKDVREKILLATIQAFNEKGMKFTMDDLAGILSMSKKTIYTYFSDKNSLLLDMVDYVFDTIKSSEQAIVDDDSLTTVQKIRAVLGVMPDGYKEIDFRQLYMLKDKYPDIYTKVEKRLESGWETTIGLLEQGISEGVIKPVNLTIFKMMMEASLEQFFQRDVLVRAGMTYSQGLEEVVKILIEGVLS